MGEIFRASTIVSADYSQFYLRKPVQRVDPTGSVIDLLEPTLDNATTLAHYVTPGDLLFTAARQWGELEVQVTVLDARPSDVGDPDDDIVEISFEADDPVTLSGWDGTGDELELPLTPGVMFRVRYSISNFDEAQRIDDPPYPERYRLVLWPEVWSPPALIQRRSRMARYWEVWTAIEFIRRRFHEIPASEMPDATARLNAFLDEVFARFPDVLNDLQTNAEGFGWAVNLAQPMIYGHPAVKGAADFRAMPELITAYARSLPRPESL